MSRNTYAEEKGTLPHMYIYRSRARGCALRTKPCAAASAKHAEQG
jgi:hypothetical protein